ncbi:persulfide dioxygenase ETHE1, mitochondrial [Anopheles gambiae]|uniref:persulfide dioxygenase ETHE1, mitochondrial n=1 Tax=Anopheles gambiae TaxID=7165 RepID=UPI002AC9A944|nr:persulfide dioxygenase ETHE1, mitochondrial [Anopheles gambiae]XP_314233.4 persulfide dioxygenase ETHE1, mitochondrial [Anopheles gambiae]
MRQLVISVRRLAAAASAAGTSVLVLPSQQQGTKLAVRTIASSAAAYIKSSTTCPFAQTATLAQGVKMLDSRKPFTEDFFFRQLFDEQSHTYSYLLADITTKEAILIDPVLEQAKRDAQLIKELGFTLKYALNTHMHADHVTGTGFLKQLLPGTVSVISQSSGAKADKHLVDNETVQFGRHELRAMSTPGHTNGCMTFLVEEQGIAFTGDTLLIRGCGRTDFQEGDSRSLYRSVHERIFTLPENFRLFPAHDYKGNMETTVAEEKRYNPRLTKDVEAFVELMNNLNLPYPKMIDKAVPANRECGLFDIPKDA